MRIAFLANEYPRPPLPCGGIGTSLGSLARALVRRGHTVWVIGWGHDLAFDDHGVQVRFVGRTSVPKLGWLLNRRRAFRALHDLVRNEGVEIVESSDWCGPSAGLQLPCPVVVRCHGSATYFADLVGGPLRPSVRWTEARALKGARAVGAVSRFTAERTRALFGLEGSIAVVHNGIETDRFEAADPAEVEAGSILYVGTLVRKKGVLDLPAMLDRLLDGKRDIRLRLLGHDSADHETGAVSTWRLIESRLSDRGREHTDYLGKVPYAEVANHIRHAAVCVFPSYGEALPMAWMEAMAAAKSVVAYDIGWAREVIQDGVTGLLVPAGDTHALAEAVATVLADQDAASIMGAHARDDVCARFSAEEAARSSVGWYERVIAGGPDREDAP